MALLEQNKARVAQEQMVDDDVLEQAYLEASSSTVVPQKRTRQDIIKELKQKRSRPGEPDSSAAPESQTQASVTEKEKPLEDVKRQGKFKPIGFKPIGAPEEGKKKKKAKNGESGKEGGERKKKKRKVENAEAEAPKAQAPTPAPITKEASSISRSQSTINAVEPEPEPLGEEFDIFAGAGDYEGLEIDEEEDEGEPGPPVKSASQEPIPAGPPRKWIETEDDMPSKPPPSPHEADDSKRIPLPSETRGRDADNHDVQIEGGEVQENEDEEERPVRLEALESSNLPSIRDFLAMDEAALAAEKRKKRKEKKKSGGGPKNMEAKVNRDFQR
jgi:IK cytokine